MIDLDYNATTPLHARVREAMREALDRFHGNPSSMHRAGRDARRAVEDARDAVASLVSRSSREVIFTSGATEANHAALESAGLRSGGVPKIAVLQTEHASILSAVKSRRKFEVTWLPVDSEGLLAMAALEEALEEKLDLVVVQAANSETGALQDILQVAQRCRQKHVPCHIDAAQLPGKVGFDLKGLEGATVALSAHKFGGPKGVGALIRCGDCGLQPWVWGGGQEQGWRAGTENVLGIVGFGVAAKRLLEEGPATDSIRELEKTFLVELHSLGVQYERFGPRDLKSRLPGTIALRLPGRLAESTMMQLDLQGICVSVGSACSSGAAEPSKTLEAMGIPLASNLETIRVSIGPLITPSDLEFAASAIARLNS